MSRFNGKGGGFAGEGNSGRFGGGDVVVEGVCGMKLGPVSVRPRRPLRFSRSFSSWRRAKSDACTKVRG